MVSSTALLVVNKPNFSLECQLSLVIKLCNRMHRNSEAEFRRSFNTTTVREQHPRSHHKGATVANATSGKGRVRTSDRRHPVLCPRQLGQDIPEFESKKKHHAAGGPGPHSEKNQVLVLLVMHTSFENIHRRCMNTILLSFL